MLRRADGSEHEVHKDHKDHKDKNFLVFSVIFVILVAAAVGRLSEAFSAAATSDQRESDDGLHVGDLAAAHHVARFA